MTELEDIFAELGISQYLQDFLDQGFDTWETILDITESDFDVLGVKLGHRRKLQRKIANSRGLSSDRALASPGRGTPTDDRQLDDTKSAIAKPDVRDGGSGVQGAKRKYRRHPKPDENAPERPPSAYVIFSNRMREDLKGRHLSFTEIAKLVGENWQTLTPAEKEPYEQQAFTAKEKYNQELNEYKKTEQYKEYARYLADFKAKQMSQQQGTSNNADAAKRPKLDGNMSNGTSSNVASPRSTDGMASRMRVESSNASTAQWSSAQPSPSTQISSMPTLTAPHNSNIPDSRAASSPAVLPGYGDSLHGAGAQTLPWREHAREDSSGPPPQPGRYVSMSSSNDRQPRYSSIASTEGLNLGNSIANSRRTVLGQAPPLLTSESTASGSSSSSFFTPRTPMEPTVERSLHFPSLYPQKSSGGYEHQLPPIRPPSLSPQSSMQVQQHSPNTIPPIIDFPTAMAPMRNYPTIGAPQAPHTDSRDARIRDLLSNTSAEDQNLDPVSALLKAGELVSRSSREQRLS
ncbi:hypothetical protein F5884DRAFT_663987 [Xylogone sp. PMI_703]|nr:hypothetical protein F5884DRAFT_663987 [Xylogone sp. PMI_703]